MSCTTLHLFLLFYVFGIDNVKFVSLSYPVYYLVHKGSIRGNFCKIKSPYVIVISFHFTSSPEYHSVRVRGRSILSGDRRLHRDYTDGASLSRLE